mmetsp:Transcript_23932/g.59655  ORF Transcript_23932/g.59655 Transcript_23932/m.59655 type:complete len:265 (+) Transcript_23932:677-1471(+)
MPAAVLEIDNTVSSSPKACVKTVGKANDKHETSNIVTLTSALLTMKVCSFSVTSRTPPRSSSSKGWRADMLAVSAMWSNPEALLPSLPNSRMPPKKNDMPRTKSMLERTEPRRVALTTSMRPALNVCIVMIISTAFPKVALSKPLTTSLCKHASSSSVASPRILASGTMARKLSQKVQAESQPNCAERMPRGKATKSVLKGWKRIDLIPIKFRVQADNGSFSDWLGTGETVMKSSRLTTSLESISCSLGLELCLRRSRLACQTT